MFGKDSVLNTHNICGNLIDLSAETAESSLHDHDVSLSHDCSRFILQRWGDALDKIEQTLTAGCDMSAVLNLVGRPEALSGCIVTPVEQSVEGFENKSFIFRFDLLTPCHHFCHLPSFPFSSRQFRLTRVLRASTHRRPGYSLPLSSGQHLTPKTRRRPQHPLACRFASMLA